MRLPPSLNGAEDDAVWLNDAVWLTEQWQHLRQAVWGEELQVGDCDARAFYPLLRAGEGASDISRVIGWLPRSSYWGKEGKGYLDSIEGFVSAYPGINQQSEKYRHTVNAKIAERLKAKQQQVEGAPSLWESDYSESDSDFDEMVPATFHYDEQLEEA